MSPNEILFDAEGHAITPIKISEKIGAFRNSYSDVTKDIIKDSKVLDKEGDVFIKCASRILKSFLMTRSGPFHENMNERLRSCWNEVGAELNEINNTVRKSGLPRDRYILELRDQEREELIADISAINRRLLRFTVGKTTHGLVGASKILFSVFPEIVLPVDNAEWSHVFKTVDIGDVLHRMVFDIQKWEAITGRQLNDLDDSRRLTTLPSVYNVMAMNARP